ncbi:metal/formaldehyde-sensitive transcriptional repressor [Sphingomonadales bacterium 56]|uniref:Metal/formaldehyde-sensitive transcriptional repressor n=1 Tax=Sphingobium agri TaxID=2933566 RepID=A0ABT0DT78_9SPHN|nr:MULTISPECIES: metal/formaldehyde-sensitive transcriptional repressor [Sphingobium]MBY2929482.1 metal/formaldehyde-sensitive transcriptional repressor [Sphingomonadales bacterium 56]MBY2958676.1 metal/formaldehyde-sensitive transcriptional repressor [Sphingomonadales bacterium 58]MCK0530315.1 metal/formaldehyde-sensitive transcriptional repressor [Sphingobium agri]CAD7337558.1 Transcriptional repressor FrmR [Sphingobium sp. S8]CAD7339554.1 Transcriptional repressor FrmR [Sphingobium sp. S6]
MHIIENRDKLLARVRRIAGQVGAIERQLGGDADCSETLQLVASVRGAVGSLMEELIEQHMRDHVARPGLTDAERQAASEEMLALIRRYGK